MLKSDVVEEKKPPVLSNKVYSSLKEIINFKLRQTYEKMKENKQLSD